MTRCKTCGKQIIVGAHAKTFGKMFWFHKDTFSIYCNRTYDAGIHAEIAEPSDVR